ncbi:hypothetical protein ACJW30_04G100000 [Castanea mollissima]
MSNNRTMTKTLALYSLTMAFFFLSGSHSARITFTNNCLNTVWPATLTADQRPQLSSTGFELSSKASLSLDAPPLWRGRIWARTECSTDNCGKFTCATAECSTGQVACNGNGAKPPASLVEIFIAADGGQDFYDVSLVDGFNLPISVATKGGSGECRASSCPTNVTKACPTELQMKGSDGRVLACKSACTAFNTSKYCCTGTFNVPKTCPPTDYSRLFKQQCLQAYSYAYDDKDSTFTCSGRPDYLITFCP